MNYSLPLRVFLTLLISASLFGCAVGPDYITPEIKTSDSFDVTAEGLNPNQAEVLWWKLFEDNTLHTLIDRALQGNKDIKIAQSRLEVSRQLLSEARFNLYPTIRAGGGYEKSSFSNNRFDDGNDNGLANNSRNSRQSESYTLGFDATWELDIFGHVRRANEEREALLEASEAGLRDVVVSLIAEVGRTYLQLRGDQNRLSVAERNATNQRETLKLTQARLDGGQATELDTSRARAQLNNTLASIPPLTATVTGGIYRLSVLLGEQPRTLEAELRPAQPLPKLPIIVGIGDPKSLLQRRPDVRIAERNLAASVAHVGVTTADLYPRITFVGNIGYDAKTPNDFGHDSEFWNFGPGISWAAFDLGRVRAIMKAAEAESEASLVQFESTVLLALEETERAFVFFNTARQTRDFLAEAAEASTKAAELANLRYRDGVTDFITVLDAERTMLEAEDRLAQNQTNAAISLIAVYKALGGGWETIVDPKEVEEQIGSILP